MLATLRKLGYGWLVVQGLVTALLPAKSIKLNVAVWGFPFENTDELEPKAWYVRAARAGGVGMVVTGVTALLLNERASDREAESPSDDADVTTPGTDETA